MKITEMTDKKSTISTRVNDYVLEQYRTSEVPLSSVVEASLVNFLKLNDIEKIKFIADNTPDNVDVSALAKNNMKWTDMLNKYTKNMGLPQNLLSTIFSGSAMGAVMLIAAAFKIGTMLLEDTDKG